ncbi:switch-associated protein 70-like [Thalassophryne amazonica]|uniref:switch-associated protein 70-like n=1 Tax=Thalassophryne amazonica TaxID=390379 RepID=UPI0014717928|nr:switch-associated protein 70-like [Thalassophryne amazonica]
MSQKTRKQQIIQAMKSSSSPTAPVSMDYKIIETGISGTIQWYNVKAGYGFIRKADTEEDIFLHHTAIRNIDPRKYCSRVGAGQTVKFDIVEGKKGPQAANAIINILDAPTTTNGPSEADQEELLNHKQELEAAKDHFKKQMAAMRKDYDTDLKATEEKYQRQLEAQMAKSRKTQEEREAEFCKQLEVKEAKAKSEQTELKDRFCKQLEVERAQFQQQLEIQEAKAKTEQTELKDRFSKELEVERAQFQKQLEIQEAKAKTEQTELKDRFSKELEVERAQFQKQLEIQEAKAGKERQEQENRFQEQLDAQEASFQKMKASMMSKSWFGVFGGVCLAVGFLSSKCLSK